MFCRMENLYTVYVLESERDGSFYKGFTQDLAQRLKQHNAGRTKSTRAKIPWRVVYTETYSTREEARNREKYLKTAAGRRFLKKTLS